jgi:preprotein translocase subunit SecA
VANDQRKVIYAQRNELMAAKDIADALHDIRIDVVNGVIDQFIPPQSIEEQWDLAGLEQALEQEFGLRADIRGWLEADENLHEEPLRERIVAELEAIYAAKEAQAGAEAMRQFEKVVMLQVLDNHWREHLASMDHLRQGIHLRGYAQKNPKQEYKREAFELFSSMLDRVKHDVVGIISKVQLQAPEEVAALEAQRRRPSEEEMQYQHAEAAALADEEGTGQPSPGGEEREQPFVREGRKVGRNEPCPCGSGKKYKHCHGRLG